MSSFFIKQGDTLPMLALTLKDGSATAIDVSGADSIKLRMRKVNSGSNAGVLKVNAEMDLTNTGSDGKVELALTADQTDTPGAYVADVLIDWGGGDLQTVPNDSFINVHIVGSVGNA